MQKTHLFRSTLGISLSFTLALAVFGSCTARDAHALPHTKNFVKRGINSRMLGGHFSSTLSRGPFALIEADTEDDGEECSGVLIGPKEVLTAAHCIAAESGETQFSAEDYTVTVGGKDYSASAIYYNSKYDPDSDVDDASSANDLGMIILNSNVTGTSPVPVASGDPVARGESATLYGYGTNANSSDSDEDDLSNGQYGSILITSAQNGVFDATYQSGYAISCSGDSGGAIVRGSGSSAQLLGVVSSGTTEDSRSGACTGSFGDSDTYVDLQNASSRAFLARFSEVVYANSNPLARFKSTVDTLIPSIKTSLRLHSLSQIKSKAAAFATKLKSISALANASRQAEYRDALAALTKIRSASRSSSAVASLRRVLADLQSLSALGSS